MDADSHRTGPDEGRTNLPVPTTSDVARAWGRCIAHGIEPGQQVQFEQVGRAALGELEEAHAELVRCAHPHLQWISRGIAETGSIVLLTNARGTVLRRYGRIDLASKDVATASRVGVSLDERCVGATAPSIALAERSPSAVAGSQHFCGSLRNFYCVAAPVENLSGELLGTVDVTSCGRPLGFDALALVVDVVRAIENAMFQPAEDLAVAAFHVHPGLAETNSACLLLVDEAWTIRAANRAARLMLGCGPSDLLGRSFGEVFDVRQGLGNPGSIEMSHWMTSGGLQLFGRLRWGCGPRTAREATYDRLFATNPTGTGQAVAPATEVLNLHEAQARSIELAMQRTRGNVSAAARLLGISRQTIYRWISR